MAATLPVRINFRLPDGWQPAPPDQVGAPGAAFVAVHPGSRDNFTANITISGELRPDAASLAQIADESVERLQRTALTVRVADRTQIGSPEAPGLTQVLRLSADVNGRLRELVQAQVYLSMRDIDDPRRRAVVQLVLTSTTGQFDSVVGDFQQFVRTVRPLGPDDATTPRDGPPAGGRPAGL